MASQILRPMQILQPTRRYLKASRRFLWATVYVSGLLLSFFVGNITGYHTKTVYAADTPSEFKIFWETWDLVVANFVDRDKVNVTEMTYGAIRGMLESLGDQNHTVFFTPEEAQQQSQSLNGEFEGIGAYVAQEEGKFTITQPMRRSPAEVAGILPGDVVLGVNGESIEGLSESAVISKIRGPAGSQVVLTVLHPNTEEPVDITITRGHIEVESVLWSRIPGNDFAYLQIAQFTADTSAELERALEAIAKQTTGDDPIRGILLDLRNNPGGYLNEAILVGSEFLEDGKIILHERDAAGNITTLKAIGKGLAREIPMIVMINEGSASAAEILAGALSENGRSQLVGETTTGTGTVLNSFNLSDGSMVRIGVTNWLTPQFKLIKDKGIQPDITIKQESSVRLLDAYSLEKMSSEELRQTTDRQFNSALLMLRLQVLEAENEKS